MKFDSKILFAVLNTQKNIEGYLKKLSQPKQQEGSFKISSAATLTTNKKDEKGVLSVLTNISEKLDTIIETIKEKNAKSGSEGGGLSGLKSIGDFFKNTFGGSQGMFLLMFYKASKWSLTQSFMDFLKVLVFIDPKTNKPFVSENSLKRLERILKVMKETANSIKTIVTSVAIFSLTFIAVAIATPLIMKGFGTFVLVIALFSLTMWAFSRFVEKDMIGRRKGSALNSFEVLTKSLAIFTLTFIAVAMAEPIIMKGFFTTVFILSVLGLLIIAFWKLSGRSGIRRRGFGLNSLISDSDDSSSPIKSLIVVASAIAILILTIVAISFLSPIILKGLFVFGLTGLVIFGFLYLLNKVGGGTDFKNIGKNIYTNFILLGIGMIVFAYGMKEVYSATKGVGLGDILVFAATLGVSLLSMYIMKNYDIGIDEVGLFALIGGSLIAFGFGMKFLNEGISGMTWESVLSFSVVMLAIGGILFLLAITQPASEIAVGLLVGLGLGILSLGAGLKFLSEIKTSKEQANSIATLMEGVFKAISNLGFKTLLLIPVITLLGLALTPLALSLNILSLINAVEKEKVEQIFYPIEYFAKMLTDEKGFGGALEKISLEDITKSLGVFTSFWMFVNAISSLPQVLNDFANLTFYRYELDKKTNQLVKKEAIPFDESTIQNVTKNISDVVYALLNPMKEIMTQIEADEDTHHAFESFATFVNAVTNIPKIIGDIANLSISTYELRKNPKTGIEELVEVSRTRMTPNDFKVASDNITLAIQSLLNPLKAISKDEDLLDFLEEDSFKNFSSALSSIGKDIFQPLADYMKSIQKPEEIVTKLNTLFDWFVTKGSDIQSFYNQSRTFMFATSNILNFGNKPEIAEKSLKNFTTFSDKLLQILDKRSEFEKFVKAFNQWSISLEKFSKSFNGLFPKNSEKLFLDWIKALENAITLGKDPNILSSIENFNKATGKLIQSNVPKEIETTKTKELTEETTINKFEKFSKNQQQEEMINLLNEKLDMVVGSLEDISRKLNNLRVVVTEIEEKRYR